jgi:hypothetical protein
LSSEILKSPVIENNVKVRDLIQQLQENNDTILYQKLEIKHLKEQLTELMARSMSSPIVVQNEQYTNPTTVGQTSSLNKKSSQIPDVPHNL